MKTFKTIAYTFAAFTFFLTIINNFNLVFLAFSIVFYLCGLGLKYNIEIEAKQVIKK